MVALNIFWVNIYWYGIFYAVSFLLWYIYIWIVVNKKLSLKSLDQWKKEEFVDDYMFHLILWVLLWGRLWYVLIYNPSFFLANPHKVFFVWEWGMAFVWAFVWVMLALLLLGKKYKIWLLSLTDIVVSFLPFWLWLWRVWNFLNKELYGIECPKTIIEKISFLCHDFGDGSMRFVSQMMESFGEWWILLIVMQYLVWKKWWLKYQWLLTWLFMIVYSLFRFSIEFIRWHPQIDYWLFFSKTQWIMIPFFIVWVYLMRKWYTKKETA